METHSGIDLFFQSPVDEISEFNKTECGIVIEEDEEEDQMDQLDQMDQNLDQNLDQLDQVNNDCIMEENVIFKKALEYWPTISWLSYNSVLADRNC